MNVADLFKNQKTAKYKIWIYLQWSIEETNYLLALWSSVEKEKKQEGAVCM